MEYTSKFDTTEENMRELEDRAIETTQDKTKEEKDPKKVIRTSGNCEINH